MLKIINKILKKNNNDQVNNDHYQENGSDNIVVINQSNKEDIKKNNEVIYKGVQKILNRHSVPLGKQVMIENIVKLDSLTARDIMIPRIDVFVLPINSKKTELETLLKKNKNIHSRIPIYENSIDDIKGILHVKYLLPWLWAKRTSINFEKIISEPYYVPESKRVMDILKEMQIQHIHLCIVVDEYGGFAGILTMEDIIEEIIGDIQDEFDNEGEIIKLINKNTFSIDARIDIEEFNENKYFQCNLPTEEADTLGGYIIMQFGYIPKLNESIDLPIGKFKIIGKKRTSITRIRFNSNTDTTLLLENKDLPKELTH